MVIPQLKILYIDIPKTGSSAVKRFLHVVFEESFDILGVSNPLWMNKFCPRHNRPYLSLEGTIKTAGTRHEPLLSFYDNLSSLHDYFIFTTVRDPFTRFKSAVVEMMAYHYFGLSDTVTSIDNICNLENKIFYPDTWVIPKKKNKLRTNFYTSKITNVDDGIILQLELILNKMKFLHNKGGWEKNSACEYPVHFWPQYYFTNLTTPEPINLLILKFENINKEFNYTKQIISDFIGIDITKYELTHINPLASQVFSYYNISSIKTIDSEVSRNGIETWNSSINDEEFKEKFPTFKDFLPEFNEKIKYLENKAISHLENHREIIERLYAEDYRRFGYEQQAINNSTKL